MKTLVFAYCVVVSTFLQCDGAAANPNIFNSAAHHWPLNRQNGITDITTNVTGAKHGTTDNIFYKGPGHGYLHAAGRAWVDLGNFTGSCLAEPARCKQALTVFLWLKYSRNKSRRYLVGTSSHLTFSKGFTIYKNSDKNANDSIVLRVNDGQREWTGYLALKAEVWSHVAFTWEYRSGLALFQNCRQMALVKEYTYRTSTTSNRSNVLEHHLTLSGAQKIYPNVGVKASFEDLAVLYRKLKSDEMNWICLHKLDAPELNTTCQGSKRWLTVKWAPPPMTYDMLTGYMVWYQSDSYSDWTKLSVQSNITSLNLTNLEPGSWYKFRVQNAFRFGFGRSSNMIKCQTKTEVLNSPFNVSVEMKSSIGTLLKWKAPPNSSRGILGYKIRYSATDSGNKTSMVKVGPVTSFLLTGLQRDTKYSVQVSSYGDKRFLDSAPASTTVKTDYDDKTSVRETFPEVIGPNTVRVKWKKPLEKYKEFSYRAFIKWESPAETENMLEVYDGNATSCVYSRKGIAVRHKFYVMAYVVREIPLIRIVDPPRNITIISLSWSQVILNWTSPFYEAAIDFADQYQLIIRSKKENVVVTTYKTHARIDGLKQMTNYLLNLRAWNRLGYGPFLDTDIHFRTPDHDECADNSHMCHVNAACSNTEGSYRCECELDFIGNGRNCEEIPEGLSDDTFCPKENLNGIEWRRTLTGGQEMTACPEETVGMALRDCSGTPAAWELPDLSNCVSKWMTDIAEQLNNPNVSVSFLANQLSNLTDVKSGKPLYAGDLKLLVDVIGLLSQRGPGTRKGNDSQDTSQTFVKAVVGTASNILDNKNLQSWNYMPRESQTKKASSLIGSLDVVALDMANTSNANATEMENIVMSVKSLKNIQSPKSLVMAQGEAGDEANAVSFPASVLFGDSTTGSKPDYATFVSYKTLAPLLTPRGEESKVKDLKKTAKSINSPIVSLNLHPLTKKRFNDPVVITLRHTVASKESSNPSCVFLEIDRNGSWSDAGCYVNSTNMTHTVCHCYHLTSFAVLMSVKQDVSSISKGHQLALRLITYVGVSISVVALCLAFLTFYFFRFSKSGRTFIHKNLTIALILGQVVFLFGINKTANKLVCKGIAIALHYFFLVSFAWMALEGVMLYLMLVKVFHTKTAPAKSKKIFFCVAWGVPIIVVVTSGVMFHQGYGTPAYCWLSLDRGFIWSFVGPVLLVLAFNFIFLGMTFRVMAQSGPGQNKKRTNKIRRWSKACMLLTCILGLTWLFGVFYINQESLFMAYFFTIFNTLQGLFIFLFHCVGDEKVRLEYRRVLCCIDPDKRYLLKPSYSNSNSKSDSSSRPMKSPTENFKAKHKTLSSSECSVEGPIESPRNTFVVHVSDGQVRVRGLATDEENINLVTNQRQSPESRSGQAASKQNRNSRRQSSPSRASEASDSDQENEQFPLNGLH